MTIRGVHEQVERKQATGSVLKALDVIEALAGARRPISLTKLTQLLELPAPTIHRLLRTLELRGYVERVDRDYRLTLKLFEIGSVVLSSIDVVAEARPSCQRLSDALANTVHVAIRSGNSAVYVMKVDHSRSLRLISHLGMHIPLHCTALGKVLLAAVPEPERSSLLGQLALDRWTDQTITTRARLEQELDEVAERGWAADLEEFQYGLVCVAAPIVDRTGTVIAAISVSGPTIADGDVPAALAVHVQAAAREVSAKVGSGLQVL